MCGLKFIIIIQHMAERDLKMGNSNKKNKKSTKMSFSDVHVSG